MRARRFLLVTVSALYFGGLIGLAFVPGSAANRAFWLWPCAAFVPVGLLLVLLLGRRRWWAALAFALLAAAWLEAAQSVWMPPGYADMADVLWSAIGAVLGLVLGVTVTSPRLKSIRLHESPRVVAQAGSREIPQD